MKSREICEPYQSEVICKYKNTKGYQTYPYHRHNGYEIYYFIQGNINFYVEDNCYLPQSGDLALLPPNCAHRIVSLDDNSYKRITINIKESFLKRISTAITDLSACFPSEMSSKWVPIHLQLEAREHFVSLAKALENSLQNEEYGADIMTQIYLSQLLLLLNKCYQQNYPAKNNIMPNLVKDTMKYIQENVCRDITMGDLAKHFYRNPTYISRIFKKHIGLTLREYMLDYRIEYAKKMLCSGHSVSEACYESGFHDYSNFIRSFKKMVGMPPGKYKSSVLARKTDCS